MSQTGTDGDLGEYRFFSWVRRGIVTELAGDPSQQDPLSGALHAARGSVNVALAVHGHGTGGNPDADQTAAVAVELYGPGDVTGIDRRHVVRTEPNDGTANFEPDYLAAIEFDLPDLPWLLTPAAPSGDRLRPWLVLVVLAAGEYDAVKTPPGPLPAINVHDVAGTLPDLAESWAWAHAQFHSPSGATGADLKDLLTQHPERVKSRLVCPRHLQPETAYTAFLVPAFDAGVAAGLGQPPAGGTTLNPAWTAQTSSPLQLPVYHQFAFHTSDRGDFESLVRRMHQRELPGEVGLRPMDVSQPDPDGAWGVPAASSSPLGMGGALRSPETRDTSWPVASDPAGTSFQAALGELVDQTSPAYDDPNPQRSTPADPKVVPSLYGRWLAPAPQVPASGWVRDLNLDPRRRGAAGLGTRVVRQERAQLMASAWQQVAGVEKANQLLRQGQLARGALGQIFAKHFLAAPTETFLALTAPAHGRVLASPRTVRATIAASRLPLASLSAAFRRVARPLGPVRRRQGAGTAAPYGMVARLNSGEISAAPPLRPPAGMTSLDQVSDRLYPVWAPPWLRPLLPWSVWLLLALLLVVVAALLALGSLGGWLPLAAALAAALAGVALALLPRAGSVAGGAAAAGQMRFQRLTPQTFSQVPPRPGFQVMPAGQAAPPAAGGGTDSQEAQAFRLATTQLAAALQSAPPYPAPAPAASLADLRAALQVRLDPEATVAARLRSVVRLDPSLPWAPADPLEPVMAAPSFPQPMYEPLRDWSQDWLLPNVKQVPPETMALLEADHAFIEAYMVGLNQELGRQLLWNGYPTDQRGSCFRQFWDVSSYVPGPADPPAGSQALREALYDIPPVTAWPLSGSLGQNDNRGIANDNLVLLLRGELLRRYPGAVIYACPAKPGDGSPGSPALVIDDAGPERHYLYRGTLAPDLTFLGFPLTLDQALGRDPAYPHGWFFVFQQVPGEPRFGLEPSDPPPPSPLAEWAQLSWANLPSQARFASPAAAPQNLDGSPVAGTIAVEQPDASEPPDNPNDPQNHWGADAAQMAYITMRRPARVAVHSLTMLAVTVSQGGGGNAGS